MLNERTSVLYETRYCAQEDFSIALCTYRSVRKLGTRSKSTSVKIHPRSKSTQSNLRTAYQSRVRVRGNSDSEK